MNINKILAQPIHKGYTRYGAQMGRYSRTKGEPGKLHLQRMRFVDGDYDTGGAYWGGTPGTALYCAFTDDFDEIRVFVRARSRDEAKRFVLDQLEEGFSFYR